MMLLDFGSDGQTSCRHAVSFVMTSAPDACKMCSQSHNFRYHVGLRLFMWECGSLVSLRACPGDRHSGWWQAENKSSTTSS